MDAQRDDRQTEAEKRHGWKPLPSGGEVFLDSAIPCMARLPNASVGDKFLSQLRYEVFIATGFHVRTERVSILHGNPPRVEVRLRLVGGNVRGQS